MRKFGRIATFLLAMVMMLAMCACSADPAKAIVGTWEYELDATEMMNEQMAASLGEDFTVDATLVMPIRLTFNDDNTGYASFDKEKTAASFESYMNALADPLVDAMYKQFEDQGISKEDADAQFSAMMGSTIEEYCKEMLGEMDVEALMGEMEDEPFIYKIEENKLYMEEDVEEFSEDAISGDSYAEIEISGSSLKIASEEGDALGFDDLDIELPIVFKKK